MRYGSLVMWKICTECGTRYQTVVETSKTCEGKCRTRRHRRLKREQSREAAKESKAGRTASVPIDDDADDELRHL